MQQAAGYTMRLSEIRDAQPAWEFAEDAAELSAYNSAACQLVASSFSLAIGSRIKWVIWVGICFRNVSGLIGCRCTQIGAAYDSILRFLPTRPFVLMSEINCKIRDSDQSVACSPRKLHSSCDELIRETTPLSLSCQRTTACLLGRLKRDDAEVFSTLVAVNLSLTQ